MYDPVITTFFNERKQSWLKSKISGVTTDVDLALLNTECEQKFSLEVWLPDAAARARQMSFSTHPCTFSHPSARKNNKDYVTSIVANAPQNHDGYLRFGNVATEMDCLGNAAALDVYKFLSLKMSDGAQFIEHLQSDSDLAVSTLSIKTESYSVLKSGFLSMLDCGNQDLVVTSSKIKQVYFPVEDSYHLLSILSNSGMIFELTSRITELKFNDEVKLSKERKKNKEFCNVGYSDVVDLTKIGYGGTKPQNISVFNSQKNGKAYLLLSIPPQLQKRTIRFPIKSFFLESIHVKGYRLLFHALHDVFTLEHQNTAIQQLRDKRVCDIIDYIVEKMWAVRAACLQQYRLETSKLSPIQKIWLTNDLQPQRQGDDEWLDEICNEISVWMIRAYEKSLLKNAILLGEAERKFLYQIIVSNKEFLR